MTGQCRVLPLERDRRTVRFQWELRPAHPAWTRSEFTLEYEDDVDLTAMPRALLWTVFLGCTHPVWGLLEGYKVEFSEPVDAAELGFWTRMAAASRRASGMPSGPAGPLGVELRSLGGEVETLQPRSTAPAGPPAVLLSCGKESLLSLGLLREIGGEVVAITLESPMPGSSDHQSRFRAEALVTLGRMPGVSVKRVRSDIRATWKNDYAVSRGGAAAINELTDCFIYPSVALPIAYQRRLPWVVLGSEWGEHHVPVRASDGWRF